MQKIILYITLLFLAFVSSLQAQETDSIKKVSFEAEALKIANEIEKITTTEKSKLKKEVESIEQQVENGEISTEKAKELKLIAAEKSASVIEEKVGVEQEKLTQLIKDKVEGKYKEDNDTVLKYQRGRFVISFQGEKNPHLKPKKDTIVQKRTTSQFVFAMGLNNLITDGESLEDSDYKVWGSHFYEWGVAFNSRILKNNNLLHAKYGMSLMYNNLRPTDNRYFVKNGEITELQDGFVNFKESRFRNVYLTVPLHLEFDFTPKKVNDKGESYFRIQESFRVGIGGYAGVRVKSKQILKYNEDGQKVKNKEKGDFNVSDFNYGLSAYVGYRAISLYAKYDINPLFKDNAVDQNNISLGVRFDFN